MADPPNGPRIVTEHERRPRWIRWLMVTTLVVIALAGSYAVYVFVTDEFSARYQAMTGDRERLLALRRELAERLRTEQLESERLRERLHPLRRQLVRAQDQTLQHVVAHERVADLGKEGQIFGIVAEGVGQLAVVHVGR